jgi:hypothetical protein
VGGGLAGEDEDADVADISSGNASAAAQQESKGDKLSLSALESGTATVSKKARGSTGSSSVTPGVSPSDPTAVLANSALSPIPQISFQHVQ